MGRIDRHDFEQISNGLKLTLLEAAEVVLDIRGRNCHTFNRLFLVADEKSGASLLTGHRPGRPQRTRMPRGHIIFIPGGTDLEFDFRPDLRFISFHFHLDLFGHFNAFAGQERIRTLPDSRGRTPELSRLLNTPGTELADLCRLQGIVLELAALFLEDTRTGLAPPAAAIRRYLPLLEFIHRHADASTRIDDLCAVAHTPRDRLSRQFSRDCGITLKHALTTSLVRRAETLLLAPEATARQVADTLRFNNEHYFSHFFKKHTGLTTQQYRQQARLG